MLAQQVQSTKTTCFSLFLFFTNHALLASFMQDPLLFLSTFVRQQNQNQNQGFSFSFWSVSQIFEAQRLESDICPSDAFCLVTSSTWLRHHDTEGEDTHLYNACRLLLVVLLLDLCVGFCPRLQDLGARPDWTSTSPSENDDEQRERSRRCLRADTALVEKKIRKRRRLKALSSSRPRVLVRGAPPTHSRPPSVHTHSKLGHAAPGWAGSFL